MTPPQDPPESKPTAQPQFFFGDPLARLLVDRLRWSPIATAAIASAAFFLAESLLALAVGTFLPSPGRPGLLTSPQAWLTFVVSMPLVWGYYVWLASAPRDVLSRLQRSGTLTLNQAETSPLPALLTGPLGFYLPCAFALAAAALDFAENLASTPLWNNPSPAALAVHTLLLLPQFYAAAACLYRYVLTSLVFRRLLQTVVVYPLHPDRAGGLRPLGQYALRITYLLALGGIVAALLEYFIYRAGQLSLTFATHAAVVLYFVLTPLLFFLPLWAAHAAMKRAKDELLLGLSRQFNQDFSQAYAELSAAPKALRDNVEKVEQLHTLHRLATAFPVWPFDAETIRRFLLAMLSPLLALLVAIASELLIRLLSP